MILLRAAYVWIRRSSRRNCMPALMPLDVFKGYWRISPRRRFMRRFRTFTIRSGVMRLLISAIWCVQGQTRVQRMKRTCRRWGFLDACGDTLTEAERMSLTLGGKLMTLECGVRFLTDYLSGDTYFRVHRPQHNLERCRCQLQLVRSMEVQWDAMVHCDYQRNPPMG